jgi:hypothetical protein
MHGLGALAASTPRSGSLDESPGSSPCTRWPPAGRAEDPTLGLRPAKECQHQAGSGTTRMSPRPSRCGAGSLSSSSDRVNRAAEKSAAITRARFYEPPARRGANRSRSCHRDAAPRQRVEPALSLLRAARHSGAVARPFVNRHDADARRAHAGEYDDAEPSRLEPPGRKGLDC